MTQSIFNHFYSSIVILGKQLIHKDFYEKINYNSHITSNGAV